MSDTIQMGSRQVSRSAYVTSTARPTDIYLGECEIHQRGVRAEGEGAAHAVTGQPGKYRIWCPVPEAGASGHWVLAGRLMAVTSTVTCDGSCMGAIGPSCDCGCGGMNHGKSWGTSATSEQLESAVLKYRERKDREQAARERKAETRERKARRDYDAWAAEYAGLLALLEAHRPDGLGQPQPGSNSFLCDIARQALVFRKILRPGQIDAAERVIAEVTARQAAKAARDAEIADRKANAKPAPEGKITLTGEIVKVKVSEGYMPDTLRMQCVVASEDGYAVLMTLPRDVESYAMSHRRDQIWEGYEDRRDNYGSVDYDGASRRWTNALRGVKITCSVTVEQSRKDPTFGFGKRPTKVTFEPVAQ